MRRWTIGLADVCENGVLLRLRAAHQDLLEVQQRMFRDEALSALVGAGGKRLEVYLAKALAFDSARGRSGQSRALLALQIGAWWRRRVGSRDAKVLLVTRPWFSVLQWYAEQHGLEAVVLPVPFSFTAWLKTHAAPGVLDTLRLLRHGRDVRALFWKQRTQGSDPPCDRAPARLVAETYAQFTLAHGEHHSDLFFLHGNELRPADVVVAFGVATDPVDRERYRALRQKGIGVVVTHPAASLTPEIAPFRSARRSGIPMPLQRRVETLRGVERSWLRECLRDYSTTRAYWADLFRSHGAKVHLSSMRFDERHCAIADGMEDVGGLSATYQKSYEALPARDWTTASDIAFCFSKAASGVLAASGSAVRVYVVTGYLGDHRFPNLRPAARQLRRRL
jgi:hypothetical protein